MTAQNHPDARRCWPWPDRYDFFATTRFLRTGENDPTVRREADGLWRAARMPSGPVSVRIIAGPGEPLEVFAGGLGATAALAVVPRWLGMHEAPWQLVSHPLTDKLLRQHPGLRLIDTGDVYEALLPTILQQKVTWQEAAFNWRRLTELCGDPAPGPADLLLPPVPRKMLAAGLDGLVDVGISWQRAKALMEVAFSAKALQRAAKMPTAQAMAHLQEVPGVGPWTASAALGMRLGRAESVI